MNLITCGYYTWAYSLVPGYKHAALEKQIANLKENK